ncbi:MAG: phage holin family protein [Bacilli bacterium]|nr:phage holin family protein [Bacilli bacterium]
MAETPVYRPRELYERQLEKQYHQEAERFYEDLAQKAGTDKALNAQHVKQYREALEELNEAKKKLSSAKAGKGWAIFGMIFCFVAAVGLIVYGAMNAATQWWFILIGVAPLFLGVMFIVLINTRIKNAVALAQQAVDEKQQKVDEALQKCRNDMAALNDMLDDSMPREVMERTTPIIDLDPTFTPERLAYLMQRFGMKEETDPDTSVLGVISGNIQGNPFILEKVFRHEVRPKTYTGELTITWTTTHSDSKGNTYTQTHTQTLHAEAVHPAPSYWDETRLIYGSEAAPHLHFSRTMSGMSGKSQKEQDKFVANRIKQLDKLEEKAVTEGRNFTKLGNDEFEAYFGADDRDHEVEYRLLFSPLAQRNELDLIKNPQPYGDDFIMVKDGMLTSVASLHSQHFDYNAPVEYFHDFDFEAGKNRFVKYCDDFIRGLFFDLAPIISIPLYQIHKPHDFIYGNDYRSNMTSFEHEAMINRMNRHLFMPEGADPELPLILKEANARKISGADEVEVKVRSYHTTPMVDYIPVHGGDGRWHDVPVHWIQYDEVQGFNNVGLVDSKKSRPEFMHASLEPLAKYLEQNFHFERGLLSFWIGGNKQHINDKDASTLENFFKPKAGN